MAEKQNSGPAPLVSIEKPPSIDGKDADSADHDIDLHGNEKEGMEEYILSGYKLAVILTGLCLAVFLIALDTSIVATAIPVISERFHSIKDIGWYGSAYLLTLCSLQPLSGKICTQFSLKWSFLSFFSIFELGSLLCGAAVNSNMLIVGRAIAGAGGAGVVSGTLSIIAHVAKLEKRPVYTAVLMSVFGVATIIGPILGGVLTQHVSWRWCFYINLPIGAVSIGTLAFLFSPPSRPAEEHPILERTEKLDLIGAFLFIPSIVMVLLALQWGGSKYPWRSATIIGLFLGFGGLLAVFIAWQWYKGDNAMIPLRLLMKRTVIFSGLTVMCTLGGVFVPIYYLPEWFQVIKGASPTHSGVMNIPMFIAQIVSSVVSGVLVTKLGYANPWIFFGSAFVAIGNGLYTTMSGSTNHDRWISYQVIQGLGSGMIAQMPLIAVQTVLSGPQTPIGISIVTFFQFFGGSLFVAIAETVFSSVLRSELVKSAPGVDVAAVIAAGSAAVRHTVTPEQLPGVLGAFNKAITSTFYVGVGGAVAAFLVGWGIEWKSVKGKKLGASEV